MSWRASSTHIPGEEYLHVRPFPPVSAENDGPPAGGEGPVPAIRDHRLWLPGADPDWLDAMPQGKITSMPIATSATSAYRRWQWCWGATPVEVAEPLPGDDMCPAPRAAFTRAITIAARPDEVWPWLVQVGFGSHGRYSYGADSPADTPADSPAGSPAASEDPV